MVDPRLGTLELTLALFVYAAFAAPRRMRAADADDLGAAPSMIELEIVDRDGVQQLQTPAPSILIGRDLTAAIRLSDPSVSRLHARIERRGPHAYVQDLGSRNGTLLNGTPLAREVPLSPRDRVRVGATEIVFMGMGEWK
ncbi:MAG: FHA domain-containing protein [Vulcanimicrobiaceae bacterium]